MFSGSSDLPYGEKESDPFAGDIGAKGEGEAKVKLKGKGGDDIDIGAEKGAKVVKEKVKEQVKEKDNGDQKCKTWQGERVRLGALLTMGAPAGPPH